MRHSGSGRKNLTSGERKHEAVKHEKAEHETSKPGALKRDPMKIVRASLGSFESRQSYAPGMFDPLRPLFRSLGYTAAAVYISDNFPDRMRRVCCLGGDGRFPDRIPLDREKPLRTAMRAALPDFSRLPGFMAERLFSHGQELGAIAAVLPGRQDKQSREAFRVLACSASVMAYVECFRTNSRRERQERDIFFAQALTSRLLIRETPAVPRLRLGFEFTRDLGAGGDFFDFFPSHDGGLTGFIGSCSGKGLRTVMEVCGIMRFIHRELHCRDSLADIVRRVNAYLVKEKRRAHQASLCLFHVDTAAQRLRMAKAGRLGLALTNRDGEVESVASNGAPFLGMADSVRVRDEEFGFQPGAGLFAATEGGWGGGEAGGKAARPWFLDVLRGALAGQGRVPLANAVFAAGYEGKTGQAAPTGPILAISVEFAGGRSPSVRRGKKCATNDGG